MQARLRAQLGDRSKYRGERRRRSVVEANSFDHNRPSTRLIPFLVLSPSCAHSLLRSFIRLHGVNHNQPFPTATSLHKIFTSFTIFIVFQCFRRRRVSKALIHCGLHRNMPKACPYVMTQFVCPSIVADINHRKPKQTKRTVPLVCFGLFALSDNLISEVFFMFLFQSPQHLSTDRWWFWLVGWGIKKR